MKVYGVWLEVSDQYGTNELVAICELPLTAEAILAKEKRRGFVKDMELLVNSMQYVSQPVGSGIR